ncbi:hypothetical protein BJX64DRAFT_278699 [Aspergillus heterothallicus]
METSQSSYVKCPDPFINELAIPYTGGYERGRWCKPVPLSADGPVSCCIPCPITDWRYSRGFSLDAVPWIAIITLVFSIVLTVTYVVLPVRVTWRHYLTTYPLIGFVLMAISFLIQLEPDIPVCHDAITPNDWKSEGHCAASGSLLIYGVWVIVLSCFFRSVSLYLHLCWEIELGNKFMYFAFLATFVGSGVVLAITLLITGASYQVGKICSINLYKSVGTFWTPLLGVSTASLVLQGLIIIYCLHRVIDPLGNVWTFLFTWRRTPRRSDAGTPLPLEPMPPLKQVWDRLSHLLHLQWRAIAIVCFIIFHVAFLAHVLLSVGSPEDYSLDEVLPWLTCLMTADDYEDCLDHASGMGPSEKITMAAWVLLPMSGIWGFLCVLHWPMVTGWVEWFQQKNRAVRHSLTRYSRQQPSDVERLMRGRTKRWRYRDGSGARESPRSKQG